MNRPTVQEAYAVLCDINRKGGIQGHDNPHDELHRRCPACEHVRDVALAAHVEACHTYVLVDGGWHGKVLRQLASCGDGAYCGIARDIIRLSIPA